MTHPPNNPNSTTRLDAPPALDAALPNRRVPAWAMSLVVHTLAGVLILLAIRTTQHGASEVTNRTGGIVLVDAQSETTEYLSEGEVAADTGQSEAESAPSPLAATDVLPPDLAGFENNANPITGAGDELAEMLPGAEALVDGPTGSPNIGGKTTTEIFGVQGTGSRFVYVFDRSQSMEGFNARPLLAARQALIASINSLGTNHQFQIIFYNDGVNIFNPDGLGSMYFATDENKRSAITFIESVRGARGTDHLNALKHAFKMGPDVIFLLTDAEGGFTASELREVQNANRSAAIINAIEFGERRGNDHSLERLAQQSGGQYIFKNIRTLRLDRP